MLEVVKMKRIGEQQTVALRIGNFSGEVVRLNEFPSREIIRAHSSFLVETGSPSRAWFG